MTVFLVLALLLCLATTAALALPLFRQRAAQPARPDQQLAIYRDQLAELDRDVARGTVTGEEAAAARIEIERRLLKAGRARQRDAAPAGHRSLALTVLILVGAVPLLAGLLYFQRGAPGIIDQPTAEQSARQVLADIRAEPGDPDGLIRELTVSLQQDMNNPRQWLVLGRALYAAGRPYDAIPAYETALQLTGGGNPELLAEYRNVLAEALTERVESDPGDIRAWRRLGDMRMSEGDIAGASEAYEQVLAIDPADAQARAALGLDAFSGQDR